MSGIDPHQGIREIDAFVIAWLLYPLSGSCQTMSSVMKSEASGIRLAVLIDTGKWCLEVALSIKQENALSILPVVCTPSPYESQLLWLH